MFSKAAVGSNWYRSQMGIKRSGRNVFSAKLVDYASRFVLTGVDEDHLSTRISFGGNLTCYALIDEMN
jgi:hypothetical protein